MGKKLDESTRRAWARPRQRRSRWAWAEGALVPALERLVLEFDCHRVSRNGDDLIAEWEFSDGLIGDVSFRPFAFDAEQGAMQTSVFVTSQPVADREVDLELWRCIPEDLGRRPPDLPPPPAALAGSSIEWLMWNEAPSNAPVVLSLRRGQEAQLVQSVEYGLRSHAFPFMDRLKTLSLMAEYLLAFDDHPRRVEIDGLRSVSREVRLPLVLISLGRLRDAEACITKFERETEADLASGKLTRVMAACRRCELLAVRRHLDATRQ